MPHVYTRLIGGLGNQLFQYAAARALAIAKNAEVKLDLTGFETYDLWRYGLDCYPIKATIASSDEIAAITNSHTRRAGPLRRLRAGLRGLVAGREQTATAHYREPHFQFDADLAAQPLPVLLEGYWQSERYFKQVANQLRVELTPLETLDPANAAIADEIESHVAVSVHVRRGDYVSDAHTNAYHGVCSREYYTKAIAHVAERLASVHLFVFSDDPKWTCTNLKTGLPTTYVTANPPDRGFRDMQLMSRCRHHVIANSSFSWWGAWLNASPDKIVVAPAKWFAVEDKDTSDLVPEAWVRL